jgi:hypothetical protein
MEQLDIALRDRGWALSRATRDDPASIKEAALRLASLFGLAIGGRGGPSGEELRPLTKDRARPRSLSARFGPHELPLHSDTAHWLVPCRYVVLSCIVEGDKSQITSLLDIERVEFDGQERATLYRTPLLIRNGARSFYGTIFQAARPFLRYDPGCMIAVSHDGLEAIQMFSAERHRLMLKTIEWEPGLILILDNWRVLHARGRSNNSDDSRLLYRVLVR